MTPELEARIREAANNMVATMMRYFDYIGPDHARINCEENIEKQLKTISQSFYVQGRQDALDAAAEIAESAVQKLWANFAGAATGNNVAKGIAKRIRELKE